MTNFEQSPKVGRGYTELNVRSTYSFLQAASSPQELVARAATLGYSAIAITDRDGLYGIVRAHEEAKKRKIQLIVGCDLTIDGEPLSTITVHIENAAGYANLCRCLTESHALHAAQKREKRKKRDDEPRNLDARLPLETLCKHASGLWALLHPPFQRDQIEMLREAFGERLSLGVSRHLDSESEPIVRDAISFSERFNVAICATNFVRYCEPKQKAIFDVLHCIREGITLNEAGRALSPNTEAHLKSHEAMASLFRDHPDWLARSGDIQNACLFSMSELKYQFPSELDAPAFEGETPNGAIRRLVYEGARNRYKNQLPATVQEQVEKELAIISKLDIAPYFLSVYSIVKIARERDILCQGRGSAANSAVCFCLGITAVDPARSNLLFERFVSEERREPPDIDVDFEHERREEVIQEIYKRYGRDRAAMVSEVISYRGKSALRDVGKVFGLDGEQIDRLSARIGHWGAISDLSDEAMREIGFDPSDRRIRQVLRCARAIQRVPRHLSIHVGGFVLSAAPLCHVSPVEPAAMEGRTVIPWDKDDLDALGFFKIDVLSLGMLTAIRKALAFVHGSSEMTAIDQLASMPKEDPAVYEALGRADTVGVFQIESRAQMAMLPRLRPVQFYDLVIQVALVRPGPIQGGMVHPYLRRRRGEEAVDMPHPMLEPILARTLGVPLFQEQVMQLAIVGASYTGGEADQLRRDMASWRRGGNLERHRERLLKGFRKLGVADSFSERIYNQIHGFAEYGFPESHAASFALLVYASAWLKTHHPAAFAAALINSQPMGFYSVNTIIRDVQRHRVEVRPVSVVKSEWDCTLEEGALRVGLRVIRGIGSGAVERILAARTERAFTSVDDVVARARLSILERTRFADAGAFGDWGGDRRQVSWTVARPRLDALFETVEWREEVPKLPPVTRQEQLMLDYENTGLSIVDHPLRLMRSQLPNTVKNSRDLARMAESIKSGEGVNVAVAGMVICRQRPQTASGVVFMTIEDEFGFVNLVLFASVYDRLRGVADASRIVLAVGKVEREAGVTHVIVRSLKRLRFDAQGGHELRTMSRDFY